MWDRAGRFVRKTGSGMLLTCVHRPASPPQAYSAVADKPSATGRLLKVGIAVLIAGAVLLLLGAVGAFYFWNSEKHVRPARRPTQRRSSVYCGASEEKIPGCSVLFIFNWLPTTFPTYTRKFFGFFFPSPRLTIHLLRCHFSCRHSESFAISALNDA